MKIAQEISGARLAAKTHLKSPLLNQTDAEIDAYILNNATNLAEIRVILKKLLKICRDSLIGADKQAADRRPRVKRIEAIKQIKPK